MCKKWQARWSLKRCSTAAGLLHSYARLTVQELKGKVKAVLSHEVLMSFPPICLISEPIANVELDDNIVQALARFA